MKKLTLAILFAMLATPAKAIELNDANYIGETVGERVCNAIWNGASTQDEAFEITIKSLSPSAQEDLSVVLNTYKEYGEDHAVSEAYLAGYAEGIRPCWNAYNSLP